ELPRHAPSALASLARLRGGRLPVADQEAFRALMAEPQRSAADRLALHFGLADVLDAAGAYEEAAEHFRQGNALRQDLWKPRAENYDPSVHVQFVDRLIEIFTPSFFQTLRGSGLDSERPVFILGLPRSGSTLIEQILASHSQVHGGGELDFMRELFESLPRFVNQGPAPLSPSPFPLPPPTGGEGRARGGTGPL